jgi:hypothetical protein
MNLQASSQWLRWGPPDSTFGHVGVVIGEGAFGPHGHVGLAYRERGEIRFVHLAWHYQLSSSELDGCAWVVSPLSNELAMLVSARCRRIARKFRDGLPYAPRFLASKFDDNAVLVLGDGEHGFTCATFVLAVFHHAGLPLIQFATWPVRSEDSMFCDRIVGSLIKSLSHLRTKREIYEQVGDAKHAKLVDDLRKRELDLERHIENVKSEPLSARFRPEEVAAASSMAGPAEFAPVVERARSIVVQFSEPC